MPQSNQEEKMRWIKPLLLKELTIKQMAQVSPFSERTLKYWLARFREAGEAGLENKSRRPKSQPNELPIRIKEKIIELRHETKLCAQKLNYKLIKEGIAVSDRVIGKIIKTEGLVRKYRVRKLKYKYIKVPLAIGELVEIDIKFVPNKIRGRRYYQFTAIDCDPFNPRLHPLDIFLTSRNIIHYLIDPGKPAQNGKVERSHRTDQEMFYNRHRFKTAVELKQEIKKWNISYNNLEHIALGGLTPNEALARVQNVCA